MLPKYCGILIFLNQEKKNGSAESKSERESAKTDIIKLLKDEQKKVKQLFQEFESLYDPSENLTDQKRETRKAAIVSELCVELANYAQAEEKIFFPAGST